MKRVLSALSIIAIVGAFGCHSATQASQSADNTNSSTGAQPANSSGDNDQPAQAPAIPSNLQTDAYYYSGLSRPEPMTFVVTQSKGNATPTEETGTEDVKFSGMQGGQAKFDVNRTGALQSLVGSESDALDANGVTELSSDLGTLAKPPLILPSNLAQGTKWTTDYTMTFSKSSITPEGGTNITHLENTVVGNQNVKTKAGDFDALYVSCDGYEVINTPEQKNQKYLLKQQEWFVKGRGQVKIVVTLSDPNGKGQLATVSVEAAPSPKS